MDDLPYRRLRMQLVALGMLHWEGLLAEYEHRLRTGDEGTAMGKVDGYLRGVRTCLHTLYIDRADRELRFPEPGPDAEIWRRGYDTAIHQIEEVLREAERQKAWLEENWLIGWRFLLVYAILIGIALLFGSEMQTGDPRSF